MSADQPTQQKSAPTVVATSVTQVAAVISAMCLSVALLYNVILFMFIDVSLITAFTISDHLATAIEMLPYAIVASLFILIRFPMRPASPEEARKWLWGLPIGGLGLWIVASLVGWPKDAGWIFGFSIAMGWATGGDFLVQQQMAQATGGTRFLARFAGLVVAMVIYNAVVAGAMLADPRSTHALILASGRLEGRLIQILERGVIIVTVPGKQVFFVARDEVKMIQKLTR